MPVNPTYPGVYVQEAPSSVHTIVPVDTATAAFVGRTLAGPVDDPRVIFSFGEFASTFGGLWSESMLGFAVQDFFRNGGAKAVVVRAYSAPKPANGGAAPDGYARVTLGDARGAQLKLKSANPGTAANNLWALIGFLDWRFNLGTHKLLPSGIRDSVAESFRKFNPAITQYDFFNMAILDKETGVFETYANLTLVDTPRRVDKVLEKSKLVRCDVLPDVSQAPAPTDDEPGTHLPALASKEQTSKDLAIPKDLPNVPGVVLFGQFANGNDGASLTKGDLSSDKVNETNKQGLYALEKTDIFNLLYIPPYEPDGSGGFKEVDGSLLSAAIDYCVKRRAVLLVDPPAEWKDPDSVTKNLKIPGLATSDHAAVYFPRLLEANPLHDNRIEPFGPCAAVAGVIARTDLARGVWKAPAGIEATLQGVSDLSYVLTDNENGLLNPHGVNCLRSFDVIGDVVWGARTMRGDDQLADQWKYLPIRRLALFIEESLYRGTKWVVFEPNDEPLWSQIRLNVGVFMHDLFRQGAFQGQSPSEAYLVKCDATTTTQSDRDRGIVNVIIGFAPLKPAEFVILTIQQLAGQLAV